MSRGECITLKEGQFPSSENLRILCGRLLAYVSVSSCILRKWLSTRLVLQSLSHLTALGLDNLVSCAGIYITDRTHAAREKDVE